MSASSIGANLVSCNASGSVSILALTCERIRISGGRFSPPKRNVCELELPNDFCDVKVIRQSQFSS